MATVGKQDREENKGRVLQAILVGFKTKKKPRRDARYFMFLLQRRSAAAPER